MIRLSRAKVGKTYRVVRVEGAGLVKRRILDLGLLPGLEIKVVRKAPLGDPIEIIAKGNPISIRKAEAEKIILEEVKG